MDLPPPLAGSLKEPFEIKVYEIDDVERLQRHRLPLREEEAKVREATSQRLGVLGVREGHLMSSLDPWRFDQAAPDITFFFFCPQPSQDVEKVGTSLDHP